MKQRSGGSTKSLWRPTLFFLVFNIRNQRRPDSLHSIKLGSQVHNFAVGFLYPSASPCNGVHLQNNDTAKRGQECNKKRYNWWSKSGQGNKRLSRSARSARRL